MLIELEPIIDEGLKISSPDLTEEHYQTWLIAVKMVLLLIEEKEKLVAKRTELSYCLIDNFEKVESATISTDRELTPDEKLRMCLRFLISVKNSY